MIPQFTGTLTTLTIVRAWLHSMWPTPLGCPIPMRGMDATVGGGTLAVAVSITGGAVYLSQFKVCVVAVLAPATPFFWSLF